MKDLPHHIKKLNRRIVRSMHRETTEEILPDIPAWPDSDRQKRKKAKIKMKKERLARTPIHKDPEERNKEMRKRVPVFDKNSMLPKHAKASQKKTPQIVVKNGKKGKSYGPSKSTSTTKRIKSKLKISPRM